MRITIAGVTISHKAPIIIRITTLSRYQEARSHAPYWPPKIEKDGQEWASWALRMAWRKRLRTAKNGANTPLRLLFYVKSLSTVHCVDESLAQDKAHGSGIICCQLLSSPNGEGSYMTIAVQVPALYKASVRFIVWCYISWIVWRAALWDARAPLNAISNIICQRLNSILSRCSLRPDYS